MSPDSSASNMRSQLGWIIYTLFKYNKIKYNKKKENSSYQIWTREKSKKSKEKEQAPEILLLTYSGVPQNYQPESYSMYAEDLVQAKVGPVIAASVSVSMYEFH